MKRIYNYTLLAVIAFATVSCNNEELTPENLSAVSGDEVQFGLLLGNPATKTVYGDEAGNAFPIYWVNEDKVQIFSPQCLEGRRSAEYEVTVSGTKQDYADALTKTGDVGIQWSSWGNNENELYSFYSLYPSGDYTLSEDGKEAENIVINYSQNIVVNGDVVKSDMEDCLMYAKTDEVERGETVNLTYNPISTVVYVTLKVAKGTGATTNKYTIQSISLVADANIAGTFSIDIADGSFGKFVAGKASSTVSAQITSSATGGFHTISNGESLSIPLFLAPVSNLNVQNWKIQVVANNTTYTKTLKIDKVLNPGEIHKITLPELSATSTEWNTENWMENIYRNVYLSEVSIPGSWNSLNKDFQGTGTSLQDQYNTGVRAFHLDCRWSTTQSDFNTSIGVAIDDLNANKVYLSVADGGGGFHVYEDLYLGFIPSGDLYQMMTPNNPSFASRLEQVVRNVKSDEYMLVFCSFAQESFNDIKKTGITWMQAISNACDAIHNSDDDELSGRIFDGSKLNAKTLVGDVLGKVIVMVNCETEIANTTLPPNSKCIFVHIPNKLTADYFPTSGFKSDNLHTSTATSSISMAVSQAQITSSTGSAITNGVRGYYPSFSQRTAVVNAILDWSKDNYGTDNYAHDKWIYLGLGGLTGKNSSSDGDSGTAGTVLNTYSTLINNRIDAMGVNNVPYYPVGIIYMNYTVKGSYSDTNGNSVDASETVKKILLLNNKYRLQYDKDKPSDYVPAL